MKNDIPQVSQAGEELVGRHNGQDSLESNYHHVRWIMNVQILEASWSTGPGLDNLL